jgi:broad specificity phosphatase PhoE
MPSLILVRHAQASFGADDYDVLSDQGRSQAAELVPELRRRGVRVERVVTGSLKRQRDTAAPVAAEWAVDAAVDPRWDEYDADDILSRYSSSPARTHRSADDSAALVTPRAFQEILESALLAWVAAGDAAETSESYPRFSARCAAALSDAAAGLSSGGAALVCTSGGVLGAVCAALLQAPAETFLSVNRVAVNAGLTKVVVGRRGATLVSLNDHGHLERDGRSLVTYR